MTEKKSKLIIFLINAFVFCMLLILHYCDFVNIRIFYANPFLPLAFLVAVSMFCSEISAFFAGLAVGVMVDTDAATSFGFNSVMFMIISLAVAFTVHYFFNNNIRSCIALGLISSIFYFLLRFLFFNAFDAEINNALNYLLTISLPSVIYTSIFAVPFYCFEKYIYKKILL